MSIHCEWAFVEISAEFSQTRFTTGIRIAGEGARGVGGGGCAALWTNGMYTV